MELQSLRSRGPSGFAGVHVDEIGALLQEESEETAEACAAEERSGLAPRPDAAGSREQLRLKAAIGMIGNVLEWADFAVFGFFSAEIGNAFFPSSNPTAEVMKTFAVFAAAFVMRPLGGVLFGHIGDSLGRKPALLLSIGMMAAATFLVGCLPTYEAAGAIAPLLLVVLRCVQGLSVGGQLVGSFLFTVEAAPKDERGFFGSLTLASAIGGTLVGSLEAGVLKSALSPEALEAWGWRLPFWLGLSVGPLGYMVKDRVKEDAPPPGTAVAAAGGEDAGPWSWAGLMQQPSVQAVLHHPLAILATAAATSILTASTYICLVWMPTFEQSLRVEDGAGPGGEAQSNRSFGYLLSTAALFCLSVAYPLVGWLSDWAGRWRVMSCGMALLAVSGPLLLRLLPGSNRPGICAAMLLFVAAASAYGAPFPAWMVEAFPRKVRYSAVGLGYNIAQALFGGTAPLLATSLAALAPETLIWVSVYLFSLTAVSSAVVLRHHWRWSLHSCNHDPGFPEE